MVTEVLRWEAARVQAPPDLWDKIRNVLDAEAANKPPPGQSDGGPALWAVPQNRRHEP